MHRMVRRKQTIYIIGAGVVGSAIAYILSKNKDYKIVVLEKNDNIPGLNQSSRNAGVIHSGIYYSKHEEPLKAKFCVEGNKLLYQFCKMKMFLIEKPANLLSQSKKVKKNTSTIFTRAL
jgi:glycerol-3-phosphate dehydrogenase